MFTTLLCVALISLAAGCVIGWICGVRVASGKQTQLRRDVADLLGDVHTLKAHAAKFKSGQSKTRLNNGVFAGRQRSRDKRQ